MRKLNDTRRLARMAFVLDELRKMAKTNTPIHSISNPEYVMCGGTGDKESYSFYRQLVYAKRDSVALVQRGAVFSASTIAKANAMFVFHDSDDETLVDDGNMVQNEGFLLARVAIVMRAARKALRADPNCDLRTIEFDRNQFVKCGGSRTILKLKKTTRHSLYRQLVLAKRDMQMVIERKRFPRVFKERLDDHKNISEGDESEEDVDGLDGEEDDEGGEGSLHEDDDGDDGDDGEEEVEDDDLKAENGEEEEEPQEDAKAGSAVPTSIVTDSTSDIPGVSQVTDMTKQGPFTVTDAANQVPGVSQAMDISKGAQGTVVGMTKKSMDFAMDGTKKVATGVTDSTKTISGTGMEFMKSGGDMMTSGAETFDTSMDLAAAGSAEAGSATDLAAASTAPDWAEEESDDCELVD